MVVGAVFVVVVFDLLLSLSRKKRDRALTEVSSSLVSSVVVFVGFSPDSESLEMLRDDANDVLGGPSTISSVAQRVSVYPARRD